MTFSPKKPHAAIWLNWLRELAAKADLSLQVSGHCMEPMLSTGNQIRVQAQRMYFPGDVLAVCVPGGQLRVHRLIGYRFHRGAVALITAPDNQIGYDPPVVLERVIGKVVSAVADRQHSIQVAGKDRVRALARFSTYVWQRLTRWLN